MPRPKPELLSGTCQDLLFSPKGGIEGLLFKTKGKIVQVPMPADLGAVTARKTGPGKRLRLLNKVDRLADYAHLQAKVLLPAVAFARERQNITTQEEAVLATTIKAGVVKAGDLEAALPGLNANQRPYQIRKLVEVGMLQPMKAGARQYSIGFSHNMLLRGVVRALTHEGFIPAALAAAGGGGGRARMSHVSKPDRATQDRVRTVELMNRHLPPGQHVRATLNHLPVRHEVWNG